MVFAAELEFVTTLVMTRCGAARVGIGSYGESKNENDRYDPRPVTTNACFQGQLARRDQKNFFAAKGPVFSRNTRVGGHDWSNDDVDGRADDHGQSAQKPNRSEVALTITGPSTLNSANRHTPHLQVRIGPGRYNDDRFANPTTPPHREAP